MVPEDGDPAPKPFPASAAFAETVAPVSQQRETPVPDSLQAIPVQPPAEGTAPEPLPPTPYLGGRTPVGTAPASFLHGNDATVAAPMEGSLPPLPEVAASNYQQEKEIARGGMGKIVAAEDRRLGRPVALKQLLEPTADQMLRFQREALITARLQHPGIVPVYEAGRFPTGEPFFAMKLVQGKPLDRVIGEANRLEDRLAIIPRLAAACDAMAYAHNERIIHRDLKPGNVLLGDFGETVVIDWGLAKDLDAAETFISENRKPANKKKPSIKVDTDSSTLTVAGAVMGTPAYMAPEQARGERVDQRADVFALGAMLYHTLAGVPPYNARTATDVIAAAALGKVVPLRERERRAPADLVAIVERAMAQDPEARYPHAGELAHELRRFLTGQLVDAHRYTAMQKVLRFVRKHQAAVTVSVLALVGFSVGGTIAVQRIVAARDAAERAGSIATTRKKAAEHLIDYMFSDMKKRLSDAGRLDLLAGLGTEVKRYYGLLQSMPGGMPREDEIRMAEAIQLIGLAEHTSGNADQALQTWKEARERIVGVVGQDKSENTRQLRRMIARFDYETGRIFQERGKDDLALGYFKKAQETFEALHKEDPAWQDVLLDSADVHDRIGDLLRIDGKIDEAFEQYSEGKNERTQAATQGSGRISDENLALSTSHFKLGSVYVNRGDSGAGLEEYQQALKLRKELLEGQPNNVELQQAVLDVQRELGELQRQLGDDTAAIESYREALPISELLVRQDPTNTDWQYQRGNLLSDFGFALSDHGSFKEGLAQLEQSIKVQQDLIGKDPKSNKYKIALSRSQTRAADAHLYLGQADQAIEQYRAALQLRQDLVDSDANNTAYRRSIAWSYAKLGRAFIDSGNEKQGLSAHEEALRIRQQLVTESPSASGFKNELASSEVELGKLIAAKDPKRASELITQGIARARMLVAGDMINLEWKETLTQGLLAQAVASHDLAVKRAALTEALGIADQVSQRAPQNAHWPGYLAEIHAGLAETAGSDAKAASAEWKQVRGILEALEKDGRLSATRKPLLDRARSHT